MSDNIFSPNEEFSNNAYINSISEYQELYKKSLYGEEAEFDFNNRFINMLN